jgi:hypothetical protein
MSPTETQNNPKSEPSGDEHPADDQQMTTFRIEIDRTGRTLLQGFHVGARFSPLRELVDESRVAEFGDHLIATQVIARLRHAAPLMVVRKDWGRIEGATLQRLCCRVETTGGAANMLFWNPVSRAARALMDMPSGHVVVRR